MARWVHRESVGSLPFEDTEENRALAASVGSTVEELNATPVDDVAADVVFDALSQTGLIGFAEQEQYVHLPAAQLTCAACGVLPM